MEYNPNINTELDSITLLNQKLNALTVEYNSYQELQKTQENLKKGMISAPGAFAWPSRRM